jgi:ribose/xylose/arabinose/galactoside ABC-type transport system permease subunit
VSATSATPGESLAPRFDVLGGLRDRGVYVAVAALVAFNLAFTSNFASLDSLRLLLIQAVPVIIVALGMALVVATEGIDLSVGAVMALASAVVPLYLGYGVEVAIAMALLCGVAVGVLNGFMIAVVGIQPIVATLAVLVGGRGLALVFADGSLTELFDPTLTYLGSERIAGVPVNVIIAGVLALLIGAMVRHTIVGRQLVAVGGNREASVLAGVPVKRTLFVVYVISGVLAAIAGLLLTGRSGAANPAYIGLDYELFAITAVVVGGTPLTGGRIRIMGTIMGGLLMQLVSTTLVSHNLTDSDRRIVTALIIVAAVALHRGRKRS